MRRLTLFRIGGALLGAWLLHLHLQPSGTSLGLGVAVGLLASTLVPLFIGAVRWIVEFTYYVWEDAKEDALIHRQAILRQQELSAGAPHGPWDRGGA